MIYVKKEKLTKFWVFLTMLFHSIHSTYYSIGDIFFAWNIPDSWKRKMQAIIALGQKHSQ